jgi:hypothetical protein
MATHFQEIAAIEYLKSLKSLTRRFVEIVQTVEIVIPDESAKADEIRNPTRFVYSPILPGSRLASRFARLGRDDEL